MIGLRSKRIISDTVIYIVLTLLVVIWLFPLVWMILKAFDVLWTGPYSPTIFPEMMGMTNFKNLFGGEGYQNYPYGQWLLNTFFVALGSCVISTLLTLMVSFALSRLRFKARKKLMNIALILGLFPGFLSIIALLYIFTEFNLDNSLFGLTLAYSLASGMGYYVVKGFFDTVPIAIDEAARIDGATKNRIFWRMIIPLSKPIIIYTILTAFIGPWCDFILAKVLINPSAVENFTVAIGIQQWLATDDNVISRKFAQFCAGGTLISVPIVLLYMIMQKFYVAGITGGAAKG
ncbi:MAG: ABC transporter permease subunit [Clostridiales bacterium]|nr:ABC transporter permease subunit [Clostridiales bacterium]MDE6618433.1 ABC transporter permease subunit [Clostridiales bacterium]